MPYEIRAYVDGYRRGGIAHHIKPTVHPGDAFTPEQIKQLENDPRIMIRQVEEAAPDTEPNAQSDRASDPDAQEPKAAAKRSR